MSIWSKRAFGVTHSLSVDISIPTADPLINSSKTHSRQILHPFTVKAKTKSTQQKIVGAGRRYIINGERWKVEAEHWKMRKEILVPIEEGVEGG
jgi:hypothetical protein